MNKKIMIFTLLLIGSQKAGAVDSAVLMAARDYAEQKSRENLNQNNEGVKAATAFDFFRQKWSSFNKNVQGVSRKLQSAAHRFKYRARNNIETSILLPLKSSFQHDAYLKAYEEKCYSKYFFNRRAMTAHDLVLDGYLNDSDDQGLVKYLSSLAKIGILQSPEYNSHILSHQAIKNSPEAIKYVKSFIPYRSSQQWEYVEKCHLKNLREKSVDEVKNARIAVVDLQRKGINAPSPIDVKKIDSAVELYDNLANRFLNAVQIEFSDDVPFNRQKARR